MHKMCIKYIVFRSPLVWKPHYCFCGFWSCSIIMPSLRCTPSPMLSSSAANAACLALAGLPSSSMTTLQGITVVPANPAACAFCGRCYFPTSSCTTTAAVRSTWLPSRRTRVPHSSASTGRLSRVLGFPRSGGGSPLLRTVHSENIFAVAATGRWEGDADGDDGVAPNRSRRSQAASWEDIQWRNVPSARATGGGDRRGDRDARSRRGGGGGYLDDEDDEDDDDDDIGLEDRRRGSARPPSNSYVR